MLDLDEAVTAFLSGTSFVQWQRGPIAGDASARSYLRLQGPDLQSAILMDARAEGPDSILPFLRIAAHLCDHGFAAPTVFKSDSMSGMIVMEDLGATDFAAHLRDTPNEEAALYLGALQVLEKLTHAPAPNDLIKMTPNLAGDMVKIVAEYYCDAPSLGAELAAVTQDCFAANCGPPDVLALRDFHAENLIWRPQETGAAKVGLLDFQDAFLAPLGYDLASLLRDARRDVMPETASALIDRFAQNLDLDPKEFNAQLACLGAQRNLRILGVFARLIRQSGKTRYTKFLPRVWSHLMTDLGNPALGDLHAIVEKHVPAPTQDFLRRWDQS